MGIYRVQTIRAQLSRLHVIEVLGEATEVALPLAELEQGDHRELVPLLPAADALYVGGGLAGGPGHPHARASRHRIVRETGRVC